VNAPAIDGNGTVFANSEDGYLYEINNGKLVNRVFTNLAIGAAYTPLSIGPDGRIYTQNDGVLFVIGN
jgi:outer membrane protein assembly factor BamB